MANEQNLIPFTSDQSREEASKNGRKGGKASGKARRAKVKMRKLVEMFAYLDVNKDVENKMRKLGIPDEGMLILMQSVVAIFNKANKGDVSAFNAIRDLLGEKPTEKQEISMPSMPNITIVAGDGRPISRSEDEIED